jgi:hypothetical protein
MTLTRTIAIGVAGGALVTWLSWAATPPPRPLLPPEPRPRALDRTSTELAREIARLRQHLTPHVAPEYSRNVFGFPASPAPAVAPRPDEARAVAPAATLRAPALTLEGMAEEPGADGVVRTAIVSAAGALYLAKTGDTIASRYRVERLSSDAADLRDLETGDELRIALR